MQRKAVILGMFIGVGILSALQAIGNSAAGGAVEKSNNQVMPSAVTAQTRSENNGADRSSVAAVAAASEGSELSPNEKAAKGELSEQKRLALGEADPQVKAASDFVGALINADGYLCARVANVVPAAGGSFVVTCVTHNNGNGRSKYLVDGSANTALPL